MRFNLLDYEVSEFEFEGRAIKLICPEKPIGKLAFKMEYWGAFPDAPVIDYSSMRYITKDNSVWENEVLKTYPNLRRYQAPGFEENPVNRLKVVVDNKIPIFMSYGLEDATVPYDFNGALLEDAYEGTDLLTVFPIPCRGHHPHGLLYDSAEIVDFIIKNS